MEVMINGFVGIPLRERVRKHKKIEGKRHKPGTLPGLLAGLYLGVVKGEHSPMRNPLERAVTFKYIDVIDYLIQKDRNHVRLRGWLCIWNCGQ